MSHQTKQKYFYITSITFYFFLPIPYFYYRYWKSIVFYLASLWRRHIHPEVHNKNTFLFYYLFQVDESLSSFLCADIICEFTWQSFSFAYCFRIIIIIYLPFSVAATLSRLSGRYYKNLIITLQWTIRFYPIVFEGLLRQWLEQSPSNEYIPCSEGLSRLGEEKWHSKFILRKIWFRSGWLSDVSLPAI